MSTPPLAIIAAVASYFDVNAADVRGHTKRTEIVQARHLSMWLMHASGSSYSAIARRFGQHHTSVMSAVKRLVERIGDAELLEAKREIEARLRAREKEGQHVPNLQRRGR